MEIEANSSSPVVVKKVWSIVRVLLFMLRKGIAKSRIMGEFHLMLKRGKLAGKAIVNNIIMYNNNNNNFNFISPRDYEFSCSNSPAIPIIKRSSNKRFFTKSHDVSTLTAVQKVLEILNNNNNNDNINSPSPFGKSPVVRQLRVTDSPFPLKDDGDTQVDKAAEEFIKKFYKDLNLQKNMPYLESPYHFSWDRC